MTVHQGRTAVYRFFSKDQTPLYVGISNSPYARWSDHAAMEWWPDVVIREIEWFDTRPKAEEEEARCISALRPKWNRLPGMPERGLPDSTRKNIRKGWTPPQGLLDLFARYEEEQSVAAGTRDQIEAEIISVMMTGVSASRLAKFLPWCTPVIQAIGKRGGVPLLRPGTVISIRAVVEDEYAA